MNLLKLPALALFLLFTLVATPVAAQQKKQPPAKTPPAPAPPPPTFDTLLAVDAYKIYGEARGVGQLIRSNSVSEVLEPILKFATPPKEFKSLINWLNTHSDAVMGSRMMIATWPSLSEIPDALVAIEFASAEEAAEFRSKLDQFLPHMFAPVPKSSSESQDKPEKPKPVAPATPPYHLQQAGTLLVITPRPLDLKKLKPAGSKLLSQDQNFRAARNRFNAESIFVFINMQQIEQEEEKRRKQYEAQREKELEERRKLEEAGAKVAAENPPPPAEEQRAVLGVGKPQISPNPEPEKETAPPNPMAMLWPMLYPPFFQVESDWPDALGIALSLEADSFDVRALMVNSPGEKSDSVPFLPMLIPGPAITPESPGIFPAQTDLLVMMSLDFAQIHAGMSNPSPAAIALYGGGRQTPEGAESHSPFAALEKQLKINIKDDLLPLLGTEVAVSFPFTGFDLLGVQMQAAPKPEQKENAAQPVGPGPFVAISVKDKEGMRRLLPKLIESMGFKGANALAQTERREDTELVSFANLFSYAFVGNFLVLSADATTSRRVVDSYLKRETLSSNIHFRNYTRWQPRQLQGQVYISPALMESYKSWAEDPHSLISEPTRLFLSRLTGVGQPITYSLSNEGMGPLHELHLPKNLVLLMVGAIAGETNPSPLVQNERVTMGTLWMIANAQARYKTEKGTGYASLEQLIAEKMISKDMVQDYGYRIEVMVTGDEFHVSAVPLEYGKSGRLSFFMDQTGVLRGSDRGGAPASASDPPVR